MRPLARTVNLVLLGLMLGMHWGVLQSVAWVSMLADRLQTESVSTALRTTFDGKHPCRICLLVREGRNADQSEARLPSKVTLVSEFWVATTEEAGWLGDGRPVAHFAPARGLSARSEPPALPPPRPA
ncbi:MAG: hypothetical protein JNK85_28540 [Verrucomicrobiales bacterium]|nr:hypothetical protein [Verrucomicrobiales bacterium]